jgi:hypothetical protein
MQPARISPNPSQVDKGIVSRKTIHPDKKTHIAIDAGFHRDDVQADHIEQSHTNWKFIGHFSREQQRIERLVREVHRHQNRSAPHHPSIVAMNWDVVLIKTLLKGIKSPLKPF